MIFKIKAIVGTSPLSEATNYEKKEFIINVIELVSNNTFR